MLFNSNKKNDWNQVEQSWVESSKKLVEKKLLIPVNLKQTGHQSVFLAEGRKSGQYCIAASEMFFVFHE